MALNLRERTIYRADEKDGYNLIDDRQKRKLINDHLSSVEPATSTPAKSQRRSRLGVRRLIKNQIHVLIFTIMHAVFSLYIRIRQLVHAVSYQTSSMVYHHHSTPQYIERDVAKLDKKPKHLSAVLKLEKRKSAADLDRLIDQTAELATWTICAGIPMLSVYEKTGILKKNMSRVYEATTQKLAFYYGGAHPSLSVTCPHKEAYSSPNHKASKGHLKLHLISSEDGRASMVDLTRTLAEMSQRGKLSPQDISMELVDAELSEGIMSEPDLLVLFEPYVELSGYPPWQIRLTEVFCLQDNEAFGYQVFLRALYNFANAEMRRGR